MAPLNFPGTEADVSCISQNWPLSVERLNECTEYLVKAQELSTTVESLLKEKGIEAVETIQNEYLDDINSVVVMARELRHLVAEHLENTTLCLSDDQITAAETTRKAMETWADRTSRAKGLFDDYERQKTKAELDKTATAASENKTTQDTSDPTLVTGVSELKVESQE